MNYPYTIVADISADIPPAFVKENDLRFISMSYTIGEEERLCSDIEDEAVLKRFYDGQRHGDLTQTSRISPRSYIDCFTPLLKQGQPILYLSLSSGLSGTYESSLLAAEELREDFPDIGIACVDSLAATGGMGLLLEAAVHNRDAGMSLADNAKWLEENRLRVCHWFMVEDLMYLLRGGRVSTATAVVGTALNIKPILKIEDDGKLVNFTKKRGAKSALKQMVDFYAESTEGGDGERIYICHADAGDKAEFLEKEIRKINSRCDITSMTLSPIIGAHVGPGMASIIHFGKRETR